MIAAGLDPAQRRPFRRLLLRLYVLGAAVGGVLAIFKLETGLIAAVGLTGLIAVRGSSTGWRQWKVRSLISKIDPKNPEPTVRRIVDAGPYRS